MSRSDLKLTRSRAEGVGAEHIALNGKDDESEHAEPLGNTKASECKWSNAESTESTESRRAQLLGKSINLGCTQLSTGVVDPIRVMPETSTTKSKSPRLWRGKLKPGLMKSKTGSSNLMRPALDAADALRGLARLCGSR